MFDCSYGETFLISLDSATEGELNFLVDCGFGYKRFIKPEIERLKKIKRFIITHFDRDHIEGAYDFLSENGSNQDSNLVEIEQIWLNTFRHIQFEKYETLELANRKKVKLEAYISESSAEISSSEGEGNISAKQAICIGSKIVENSYLWNDDFNKLAVTIENGTNIQITDDISIILLSPDKNKLKELEFEFKKEIYKLLNISEIPENEIFDDAFEYFVQRHEFNQIGYTETEISAKGESLSVSDIKDLSKEERYRSDESFANGSSIAFILKTRDKKILFLADAHSEIIEKQLKQQFPNCQKQPIVFDAIKVSHHGAQGNNSPDLLKLIDSERYLISTNGKHPRGHKHPDLETIARIVSRPILNNIKRRNIYFNYELPHISGFQNENLKSKFHYEIFVRGEIDL